MIDGQSVQDKNIGIKTKQKSKEIIWKVKIVVTSGRKRKEPVLERDP